MDAEEEDGKDEYLDFVTDIEFAILVMAQVT